MNKFHIIGSGACGFLRIYYILKKYLPIKYKNGGPKYQNSFQTWDDDTGLIWDSELLSEEERIRRVSLCDNTTNITHSYLKYVSEFVQLDSSIKFLCFRGERDHSIKSLATSWGYRNPCFVSDRKLGIGHNRYAVNQFPNFSNSKNHFHATEKYWDEYYNIANELEERYPNNFLIVDSPKFFKDGNYQIECMRWVGMTNFFNPILIPIDFDDWTISTTLHGGLGNNLFQLSEVISFCKQYNLNDPVFGTWDLFNFNEKYPSSYNCDKFLGGHIGTHVDLKKTFSNLNWKENLISSFDTKFVINDMFRFSDAVCLAEIRKKLSIESNPKLNTVSLHLRYCTQSADDHVNGYVDNEFYCKVFQKIPSKCKVFIFSDDRKRAENQLTWFKKNFNNDFEIFDGDAFQTLKKMVECEYHILHVSTFSFWGAFLDPNQPNSKVFYPKSFVNTHTEYMIPYKEWQMI